jgi:hypothetical protein
MSDLITYAPGILPRGFKGCVAEVFIPIPVHKGKQRTQGSRASRTPGKTKGEHCTSKGLKKFFACHPKAYLHPQYNEWLDYFKQMNSGSKIGLTPVK